MEFAVLVILAPPAIGVFWSLSHSAADGNELARGFAILEAVALLVPALVGLLAALYLLAARCDEGCDDGLEPTARSGDWWNTIDAWQWSAQFLAESAGVAAIVLALVFTIRRRHDLAPPCLLAAALLSCVWAALIAPLGEEFGI